MIPCNFDHNGECLVCDCFSEYCGWQRYLRKDYTYENKEELEKLFEDESKINSKFALLWEARKDEEINS